MRILHLNTERTWRGGETQLLLLALGLKARGHHQWIVGQPESPILERSESRGLQVLPIHMSTEFSPSAIWGLSRWYKRLGIDILHMHTSRACTIGGMASLISNVKVKVISRRVDFTLRNNMFRKIKYEWGVDRIIAVSSAIRDILIEDNIDKDRIVVNRSGIDLSRFDPHRSGKRFRDELGLNHDTPVIGNIAHFADHKGHRYLVEAARDVIRNIPNARFVLIGDGELRPSVENQVRASNLEGKVIFTGFRSDIPDILAALDLFVLSSHLEGLCTSLMDAMAMAKPIVSTQTGGIPEVVEDGVTGLLVPPKNPEALARAIIRMLSNNELRQKMGEAGRERAVSQFNADRMVNRTEELYETLLEGKASPG